MISSVRVVIVAWNSGPHLDRCLAALLATEWRRGPLELIVTDNDSRDGSTEDWANRHPGVELRRTGANLGFTGGANRGLDDLEGLDAVALVNPDAFVDPAWLEALATALDADPRVGAACPKILFDEADPAGRAVINNVGNELGPRWEPHDRGYGEVDRGQYDRPEDVWGWCGGAVLLRRTYLEQVGRFDERLFMYGEDVDLSWRGRRLGWRYRYVPTAVVHHVHRGSSGGQRTPLLDYLNRRNRLVVVTRHGGLRGALIAWSRATGGIVVELAASIGALLVGRRPSDGALRRRVVAARDALRLLRGGVVELPPALAGDRDQRRNIG